MVSVAFLFILSVSESDTRSFLRKEGIPKGSEGKGIINPGFEEEKLQLRFLGGIKKLPLTFRIVKAEDGDERMDSIPIETIEEGDNKGVRRKFDDGHILLYDSPIEGDKSPKALVETISSPVGYTHFKISAAQEADEEEAKKYIEEVAVYDFSIKGEEIPAHQMRVVADKENDGVPYSIIDPIIRVTHL